MRIVIGGGSGFLGRALSSALRGAGHQVIVLTRRPSQDGDLLWSPDVEGGAWVAAVHAADVVVNLAGEGIADKRWSAPRKDAILNSRVRATRALASALREAVRPAVFLSSSAVGFYGDCGDAEVTETRAPSSDFLARTCVAWELEARAVADVTRTVLLRTGVVLAREGGALPQMALPFRFFAGGPLGSGRQFMSWIHCDDWVAMVRWAIDSAAVSGPVNVTAPTPVRNVDFARTLGRVLGRPALLHTPAFALRLALGELADVAILSGQRALPAFALANGFRFRYPELGPALQAIYAQA
jgi:uncharacterized protein (TIGR01777 family)